MKDLLQTMCPVLHLIRERTKILRLRLLQQEEKNLTTFTQTESKEIQKEVHTTKTNGCNAS